MAFGSSMSAGGRNGLFRVQRVPAAIPIVTRLLEGLFDHHFRLEMMPMEHRTCAANAASAEQR